MSEVNESEAYKKYKDYYEWMNRHPIKFAKQIAGKLRWDQKISVICLHVKCRIKCKIREWAFNRTIGKYISK